MKQVGVVAGQHPDDDEDDTIPRIPLRGRNIPCSSSNELPSNARSYAVDAVEKLGATHPNPMAIASPKNPRGAGTSLSIQPRNQHTRLESFHEDGTGAVQFVKELPREQLERKFLLGKMQAA
jgi:hypothetical protein